MKKLVCNICQGSDFRMVSDDAYMCQSCGMVYSTVQMRRLMREVGSEEAVPAPEPAPIPDPAPAPAPFPEPAEMPFFREPEPEIKYSAAAPVIPDAEEIIKEEITYGNEESLPTDDERLMNLRMPEDLPVCEEQPVRKEQPVPVVPPVQEKPPVQVQPPVKEKPPVQVQPPVQPAAPSYVRREKNTCPQCGSKNIEVNGVAVNQKRGLGYVLSGQAFLNAGMKHGAALRSAFSNAPNAKCYDCGHEWRE